MNGVNVTQTARAFIAAVDDFKNARMRRAVALALNKTAEGVRVDASREIRARYKLKVATVNKAFSIQRASSGHLQAVVRVRGRPLNLGNFDARQTAKGVTVNVKGVRKLIPHAFIVRVPTKDGEGTVGVVFIRDGSPRPGRLPIKALTTIDVPGVFSLKDVQAILRDLALDRFNNELRRAVLAVQSGV